VRDKSMRMVRYYVKTMSYAQVAEEFGMSRSAARDTVKRCLERILGYDWERVILRRELEMRGFVVDDKDSENLQEGRP
jgi:predicted DNA-binding protein YlxM (UPF0122 family)